MKVDLVFSTIPPVEEKKPAGGEDVRESTGVDRAVFSSILETMVKEMKALEKEEGPPPEEPRHELIQFIQSVERADEKFRTAMAYRETLLKAYQDVAGGNEE